MFTMDTEASPAVEVVLADAAQVATVVVAEAGAGHSMPFGQLWGLTVLQQADDEPAPALAQRVTRAVNRVHRNAQRVSSAWLLLNGRGGEPRAEARGAIAHTLASALAEAGGGMMMVVATVGEQAEGRAAVFALIDALLELKTSAPITVRVIFNRAPIGS